MNPYFIGTSHIAQESIYKIKNYIENEKPDIVAIELDHQRAHALVHDEHRSLSLGDIRRLGAKGYLFAKLGQYLQQKLGRMVGIAQIGRAHV